MMGLERFIQAQDQMYECALKEIQSGRKRSHWIWYIFPQLKGLGHSANSEYYGLADLDEARAYLHQPVLKKHLFEITQALLALKTDNIVDVLGEIDALKLRSSMTLFHKADPSISLFPDVISRYYDGHYDEKTLDRLSLKIAVFCGSAQGCDPAYQQAGEALGAWIGDHHHALVYGGGHAGVMGDVSLSALAHHAEVISVVPSFLKRDEDSRIRHIEVPDMSTRKKTMIQMADAIVALPGGPGTLEEISDVVTLVRLRQLDRPYCLYNVNGFYDQLAAFYDEMVDKGFLTKENRQQIRFVNDLEEVEKIIES